MFWYRWELIYFLAYILYIYEKVLTKILLFFGWADFTENFAIPTYYIEPIASLVLNLIFLRFTALKLSSNNKQTGWKCSYYIYRISKSLNYIKTNMNFRGYLNTITIHACEWKNTVKLKIKSIK